MVPAKRATETGGDLWVAWERHRRSRELASRLGVELRELLASSPYLLRVAALSARTLALLLRRRPRLLIVQNPSLVLTALAVAARPALGYALVVDRHSNFKLGRLPSRAPKWRLFHALSRMTVRRADLTIVTNDHLADLVAAWGGRPFVLPDAVPSLDLATPGRPTRRPTVVCVCSHGTDEPLAEVLAAARLARSRPMIQVTGDPRRADPALVASAPDNVSFTGFLPEPEYQSLLASSDAVLCLTTQPHTLLCGAYEAVAAGRPLIVSDQEVLVAYFRRGTVATANTAAGIAAAIDEAVERGDDLRREMAEFAPELKESWRRRFAELLDRLDGLRRSPERGEAGERR